MFSHSAGGRAADAVVAEQVGVGEHHHAARAVLGGDHQRRPGHRGRRVGAREHPRAVLAAIVVAR